jgi:hypothetical protein
MFDFIKAAHDLSSMVNNFDDENQEDKFYYEITPKILQMKWTDIEIKKYRLHEFTKEKTGELEEESEDEDLPDIEVFDNGDAVRNLEQDKIKNQLQIFPHDSSQTLINRLHEFSSSSDDELGWNGEFTNLEELD